METLAGLTMSHTEAFPIERSSIEEVQSIHVTIVEALVARDADRAKRLLSEHLAVSKFPPRGAGGRDDALEEAPAAPAGTTAGLRA